MTSVEISQVQPRDVTDEFTEFLQRMALDSWQEALPRRPDAALRHHFNPDSPRHIEHVGKIYADFATIGGLLVAREVGQGSHGDLIGFLLVHPDVSPHGMSFIGTGLRRYKQWRFDRQPEVPGHVFAHIQHIVVDTVHKRQGVASQMLYQGLALSMFRGNQISTAHIFPENRAATEAFRKWGYRKFPVDQTPEELPGYFGTGVITPKVWQFQYAAPINTARAYAFAASQRI